MRQGRSAVIPHAGRRLFFDVQAPSIRLFAIGATDIAQTLAVVADLAGFEVIVIDPRSAYATPERFPKTPIAAEWPETALPGLGLDCYTAVALLAHEPRIGDDHQAALGVFIVCVGISRNEGTIAGHAGRHAV